jgi:hypothetical protein
MSFVRNLANDLVEKRLWPIAAVLLAAIVAVPLLLSGGSSTPSSSERTAANAPALAAAVPASPVRVTLDSSVPAAKRYRKGRVRNPFRQQYQPKTESASATGGGRAPAMATAPAAASPSSATVTSRSDSSDPKTGLVKHPSTTKKSTTKKSTTKKTPATATKPTRGKKYRVAWRFGLGDALEGNHDAARLTALPSAEDPMAMFLGVLSDGRTAVFLVRPGTQVSGDGWCRPKPEDCQTIEMRRGDIVSLNQYRLHLVRVQKRTVSAKVAKRSHARVSKAGRKVYVEAREAKVPGIAEFVFDRVLGLLKPAQG